MRQAPKKYLIFALSFYLVLAYRPLSGQESAGQDIKKIRNIAEAISASKELLEKFPESDFTPNVMFQLVELYAKRSVLNFQRDMLVFEEAEENYDKGLLKDEPPLPRIDYSDAINLANELLKKFPNVSFRDKVLYRIAFCHLEEGDEAKAMAHFDSLARETTDKQLLEESYFRLGEYYFEQKEFQSAVDIYTKLLNSWDSPYFDIALYKLGWCYYNLDNYADAIGYFLYLMDDIKLLERLEMQFLGKTKADLRSEAIEYIAICFAEFGGAAKASEFLEEHKEKDYSKTVLLHLVDIYQKRNFYADAIETLNVLLDFYPFNPEAAKFQKQIVENYELAGEKAQADEAREKLIAQYGPGSDWLKQIPAGEVRQEILSIAEEFLYTLGAQAQERAQASKDAAEYELAVAKYREFIEKFESSKRAHKVQFYLAESLYESGKFDQAAEAYFDLILKYPDTEFRETAAYNRILAYNHLLQTNGKVDSSEFFLYNFLGKSEEHLDVIKVKNRHQAQLLQACNDFYIFHSESQKLPEVLINYAQILYELEYFSFAKGVYQKVLDRAPQNHLLPQAYIMIAQCDFKLENYLQAETAFRQVVELFPDSVKYVARANKMIASSTFKNAETYLTNGDTVSAANEFEKVSNLTADPDIAERALFEAALQFETLGNKNKAVELYERLAPQFPKSELIDESLFKAAVLNEELENWPRAAQNYLALYKHDQNSQYASKSLFLAAKSYENAGDFDKARTYYQEYTIVYPGDPDRYLEAAFKRGEIAYNQDLKKVALKDFQFVIETYDKFVRQNINVESYIPANAQFLIAEISLASFKKIKLKPPLKRNLKRKRSAFQRVIKAYTAAAKYKVAEWTTASSYKIGATFEAFADAVFNSPRPKKLSAENLKKYNDKLWQTVVPFKEKALETYQANIKQASENQIENNWILESKKRVEALSAELDISSVKLSQETGL